MGKLACQIVITVTVVLEFLLFYTLCAEWARMYGTGVAGNHGAR